MISKKEFFLTTKTNIKLKGSSWQISNKSVALVVFLHGTVGYVDRFDTLARYLCKKGISCIGISFRGAGGSEGKKGDIPSFETYFEDLELLLSYVSEHFSGTPIFLYGQSFGANIGFEYAIQERNPVVKGVIASSPMVDLIEKVPPLSKSLTHLLNTFVPNLSIPFSFDTNSLSHDPVVVNRFNEDPLVSSKTTVRTGAMILEHLKFATHYEGAIQYPILFMHGSADKLVSAKSTRELASRITGDVQYKEWDGLYHELHHESEKAQVLDYAIDWMLDHL